MKHKSCSPNTRPAFTLVEILIVVAIIGLLAAIAVPKFARVSQRAHMATMLVDLHHLATAQDNWAESHGGIFIPTGSTTNTAASGPQPIQGADGKVVFLPSSGVTIAFVAIPASPTTLPGWSAVATHVAISHTCAIFYNLTTPPAPATREGEPKCDN